VTFPIDFALMQYFVVFQIKSYAYCKNETSNENLELNKELAKNCSSISQMELIL